MNGLTKSINDMLKKIIETNNRNLVAFILRLTLGVVIFPHGAQKLLGAFGGYGYDGTMGFFTQTMGLPWIIGFLVILIEFFGAILLLAGLAGRVMAFCISIVMLGVVFTSHIQYGFFQNWSGKQGGEGIEFFILAIGISIALIVSGSGKWSVDALLQAGWKHQRVLS